MVLLHSHRPSFHLHSDQSGLVDIRHERAADKRDRPQYLPLHIHVDCAVDYLRSQLFIPTFYETFG